MAIDDPAEQFEQLRRNELRLNELADNINEIFFVVDSDFSQLYYVNNVYEELSGKFIESLYANPLSFLEAVHPEDREDVQEALERVQDGQEES